MADDNIKEFRVSEYVQGFEKSLNYMAAVLFAILVTAFYCLCQEQNWKEILNELLHNLYSEPKNVFFIIVAVLPTLPYYLFYTLKDDIRWYTEDREKDISGLLKIFTLYEFGILSIFYLLMQGDKRFAGSKLIISCINIVLLSIYVYLIAKDKKVNKGFEYFYVIIFLMFVLFGYLCIHSFGNLRKNCANQNYSFIRLMLLFVINTVINSYFLMKCESRDKIGIISNRIKIIIPILSMSAFTASVFYCFFVYKTSYKPMLFIAAWITLYEICLSVIKSRDARWKDFFCVISFIVFVLGIPMIIIYNSHLSDNLIMKWFMLIGTSIYMAAIKYWGYVLKIYNMHKERKNLESEKMVMLAWFRNSILGSMFFLTILLLNRQYFPFLISILFFSILSEMYISYNILYNRMEYINKSHSHNGGKVLEFAAITVPVFAFIFSSSQDSEFSISLIANIEIFSDSLILVFLGVVFFIFVFISQKLRSNETSFIPWNERTFYNNKLDIIKGIYENFRNIVLDIKSVMPGYGQGVFYEILCLETIYVILAMFFLYSIPPSKEYSFWGTYVILIIVVSDWFLVSKYLINYYMEKIKMGEKTSDYFYKFKEKWSTYIGSMSDIREVDAKQLNIGSQWRPMLFFMGSSYDSYDNLSPEDYDHIAQAACSLELIHKASVMYDDFIDNDDFRHGEKTFHAQYKDTNILILLGNTMISKAQKNFVDCTSFFKCDDDVTIKNLGELSEIVSDLCKGCYRELFKLNYKMREQELQDVIHLETVSLIKGSIGLGYSCFHKSQGDNAHTYLEELGEAFGYMFQWLNDLEPFSMVELYTKHKGNGANYDLSKKNIALWKLYQELPEKQKKTFGELEYEEIIKLYNQNEIEKKVLDMVKQKMDKIDEILEKLKSGNEEWVEAFRSLLKTVIQEKGWDGKF